MKESQNSHSVPLKTKIIMMITNNYMKWHFQSHFYGLLSEDIHSKGTFFRSDFLKWQTNKKKSVVVFSCRGRIHASKQNQPQLLWQLLLVTCCYYWVRGKPDRTQKSCELAHLYSHVSKLMWFHILMETCNHAIEAKCPHLHYLHNEELQSPSHSRTARI